MLIDLQYWNFHRHRPASVIHLNYVVSWSVNLFIYHYFFSTPEFSCSEFKNDIDFTKWNSCVPQDGGWSSWRSLPGGCMSRRVCNNPAPNRCGKPCSGSSFQNKCSLPDLRMQAPSKPSNPFLGFTFRRHDDIRHM